MTRSPVSYTTTLEQGDITSTGSHYCVVESSTEDTVNIISLGGEDGKATRSVIPSTQLLEKITIPGQRGKNEVHKLALEHIIKPIVDVGIAYVCGAFVIACSTGKYASAFRGAATQSCQICMDINAKIKTKKAGKL